MDAHPRGQVDIGREAVMERQESLARTPEGTLWVRVMHCAIEELRALAAGHRWAYVASFIGRPGEHGTARFSRLIYSHVGFWCGGPELSNLPRICESLGLDQAAVLAIALPLLERMLAVAREREIPFNEARVLEMIATARERVLEEAA